MWERIASATGIGNRMTFLIAIKAASLVAEGIQLLQQKPISNIKPNVGADCIRDGVLGMGCQSGLQQELCIFCLASRLQASSLKGFSSHNRSLFEP